jgi:hypothetical protein
MTLRDRGMTSGPLSPVFAAPAASVFMGHPVVTTAGTAVPVSVPQQIESGIHIKANTGNGGDIFVGGPGVNSGNGFILAAGEAMFIEIDGLSKIYIDAAQNGDGVSFIAS